MKPKPTAREKTLQRRIEFLLRHGDVIREGYGGKYFFFREDHGLSVPKLYDSVEKAIDGSIRRGW